MATRLALFFLLHVCPVLLFVSFYILFTPTNNKKLQKLVREGKNLCLSVIILNYVCRLNISVSSSATERETPYRRTPQRGMKRKRQVIEEEFQKSAYQSTARSVGDIDIVEDCPEGKFVKLFNKSDKVGILMDSIVLR